MRRTRNRTAHSVELAIVESADSTLYPHIDHCADCHSIVRVVETVGWHSKNSDAASRVERVGMIGLDNPALGGSEVEEYRSIDWQT